jgi:pimeloyl-ACP methyl ester carboxylesterase
VKRRTLVAGLAATGLSLTGSALAQTDSGTPAEQNPGTGYAPINGLQMYYELRGAGEPLVLLHGAYMHTGAMEPLLSELARTHQVIAADFQGHGRTADIDRPITYEHLADDIAALMDYLGVGQADVVGYSMGASTGLLLTLRHPEKVRKLVAASGQYRLDGMYPEVISMIAQITPEMFIQSPFYDAYAAVAPDTSQFPQVVEKLKKLDADDFAWPEEEIAALSQPALLIYGDADVIRLDHAVALFRLLGGGVPGDLMGLPKAQLAILPGTTHITVLDHFPWLGSMVDEFLTAPLPEATPTATG